MLAERGGIATEVTMWTVLFVNAATDVLFLVACSMASDQGINLRPIVEQIPLRQISDIISLGSVLLWRILSIHIIEVSLEVQSHKRDAFQQLPTEMKRIMEVIADQIPDSWRGKMPAYHAHLIRLIDM